MMPDVHPITRSGRRVLGSSPKRAWWGLLLIRLMVGAVFLSEGLQKFLFPDVRGVGRFERMGFPEPELLGYTVGSFEVVCGTLVLVGLGTRLAALPLVGIMLTALVTTKLPILLGRDLGPFQVRDLDAYGFWAMAHEMRTDWAMLLGTLVLVMAGSGPLALDRRLRRRTTPVPPRTSASADSPTLPHDG